MDQYNYSELSGEQIHELCRRPKMDFDEVFRKIGPILERVRGEGDRAVLDYTRKFDGVSLEQLTETPADPGDALDEKNRKAIDTAYRNIYRFHKAQLPAPIEVETMPGIRCRRLPRPIERVGLYVPGGTASLPSTLLMLGIPAMIAGCREIVITTPPGENGDIAPELSYIATRIGASRIVKAGGAQAIAAMAYGTETVPKTDKIFGPGNQYVTAAKMTLQNSEAMVAIDMPAGPSEVLVIADHSAKPEYVAADLLSQAEHGTDSQVVLVATKSFDLEALKRQLKQQLKDLPRGDIAGEAISRSFVLVVDSLDQAFEFSNQYAPEHLIVQCKDAGNYVDHIRHAGSVFLGNWSPESVGDYASGTNHTLPTYGFARMYSGVSVESFIKYITTQELTREGLEKIAPTVERLAELEDLEAHKRAVTIRRTK